ncbi:MAG TPA: cytochrome c3 family protein [Polyangiaceae bacterium]
MWHEPPIAQLEARHEQASHAGLHPRFALNTYRVRFFLVCSALSALLTAAGAALAYYATDYHLTVGYRPVQPVEFSHRLHAGKLALDCRFCHSAAERGPMAGIADTELCMNCHSQILADSVKLLPVRASLAQKQPIRWVRVGKLPEFAYFNHSAHLSVNVGCSTCHGRVDLMERTQQAVAHTMGFCVDCHRQPESFLRTSEDVANMHWQPRRVSSSGSSPREAGERRLSPPLDCSGCHR